MKTKIYAKKTLSVFLAVMMLMSAWVFVAPQQASAAATNADVSNANKQAVSGFTSLTDVNFTTTYGSFNGDSGVEGSYTDSQRAQVYKNVIYSPLVKKGTDENCAVRWSNVTLTKAENYIRYFFPNTVMVYDGTTPSTPVVMAMKSDSATYIHGLSGYINNTSEGITLGNTRWRGYGSDDTTRAVENPQFLYSYFQGGNTAFTTDGTQDTSARWRHEQKRYARFWSNRLTFTGSFGTDEYFKAIKPGLCWIGGNNNGEGVKTLTPDGANGTVKSADGKVNKTIYVLDVVKLNAARAQVAKIAKEIYDNPAKFTTASVNTFKTYAQALADININTAFSGTTDSNVASKVSTCATNIKNAVDDLNTWTANNTYSFTSESTTYKTGLQIQKYTISVEDYAGNVLDTVDKAYGTTINYADITSGYANSAATYYNDSYHDTYTWPTGSTTITDNFTIKEQKVSPSQSHTFGAPVDVNDTYHEITCTVCGYAKQVNHVYDTGVVTTEATCETTGIRTYTCSGCSGTKEETISALGHSFTSGTYKEKESGEDGTHYQKCIRCDKYGMGVTVDNCEKHTWKEESRVDATCEADGSITYKCTVCGSTSYVVTLGKLGHSVSKTEAQAPTKCGEIGWTEFWQCSTCKKAWSDEAKITVINSADTNNNGIPDGAEYVNAHDFTGACQAKTSGTADSLHYYKCLYCNAYGYNGVENAGTTHTWNEGSITKAATCTAEGVKTYKCTACNGSYNEAVAKLPHTMTKIEADPATCLKAGNNEYYHCSVCNKYYKDEAGVTATTPQDEVVKALGHTFAEGNNDTQKPESDDLVSAATCQSPAFYRVTCDRCNTEATDTYPYGEADTVNGHSFGGAAIKNADGTHSYKCQISGCNEVGNKTPCTYEVTKDVASTCKTQGYTTYTCKDCGHGYTEMKDLNAANHEGDTEVRNALVASCNTPGYTGDTYCLGCKTKIADGEAIAVDKTNHENMVDYARVESTCQTAGHKAYKYCDKCGTYGTAKENLALKPHQYTTYISNGDGTHTATCDTCDSTVATPATDKQNCSGGTANCVDKAVCTVCNGEYGELDSTKHKDIDFITKLDSTCQKEGHDAYRHCDACNSDLDEITVIAKKEHAWGSWTKVEGEDKHTRACTTCDAAVAEIATETENCSGGTANCIEKAKCSACKSAYGNVNTANHKTTANTLKNAVAATCVAPGYTGDYHYNCCDAIKEKGTEIPQLDHSYTVEVEGSRTPATCIAEGEVTFSCATCPEGTTPATSKVTLPIDKTNHASTEEITVGYKAATCTQEGYTGDVYHACCYNADPGADNKYALIRRGSKIEANGQHVLGTAVPEYMLEKDAEGKAVIITNEEGNKTFDVKAAEPSYAEKIAARHADSKWYHAQICSECGEVVYSACYTYEHTYNCQDTDICEVCNGLCSLINENLHPNGLTLVSGKPATCQEDGVKAYYICEYCGKTYLDAAGNVEFDPNSEEGKQQLVISKDSAPCTIDWDNPVEIVEGTCGTEGYKVYRCTEEGCTKDDIIVSTGLATNKHTWNTEAEIITEPTCGSLGYKAIKCSVCGSIKPNSYETIPTTGEHDYVLINTEEGTSCTDPSIETYECTKCGDTYETESTEGVSAHTWGEWETIGGDCATGVVQIRTCSVCGTQEQQVITTVDHDLIVKVRVEATCEEKGYITYVCKNCGYEETEIIPVDPTIEGHVLNTDYYVTVEKATCENAEMREYTCLLCGEKVVKPYGEMLDHVWLLQAEEIATCETAGHSAYYRCVRCLAELNEGDVIKEIYPALGHNDADNDGKCDECNKVLYEDGTVKCSCLCHKEGWLMQFIYKIVNFFWKLFKINHSCACGATHY